MPDLKLQQCIQAALSYRDKARRLCAECDAAFAAGHLDRALYEREHGTYAAHARMAEERLRELRTAAIPRIERLGRHLRRMLAKRQALTDAPSNARKRKLPVLDVSIERLRAEIAWYNALLSAETPDRAGGLVELPLDKYARLTRPRGTEFSLTQSNLILAGITAALLIVAVVSTYLVFAPGRNVAVTASRITADNDIVALRCTNAGDRPVTLYVPWGGNRTGSGKDAYGVDIYLRGQEQDDFRLWLDTAGVWYYEGRAMRDRDAITVPPFLEAEIRFNLSQIRRTEPETASIKFVVSDQWGRPVYTGVF